MYEWSKKSDAQKEEILRYRRQRGWPLHAPPHPDRGEGVYLITAACYRHQPILEPSERRTEWEHRLLSGMDGLPDTECRGWVIGPNHYHLLVKTRLEAFAKWLGREHNRSSSVWNREDKLQGRKVWYRFSDRKIRTEGHFWASLNYVHRNPVKHGWVEDIVDWPWSSYILYRKEMGEGEMHRIETSYPVDAMGKGWDD